MKSSAIFLSLFFIGLTAQAIAATPVLREIECHDSLNERIVRIDIELVPSDAQAKPHVALLAGIFEQTQSGLQLIDRIEVRRSQNPSPGAPRVYTGQDFELTVQMNASSENGQRSGRLEADTRSGKISEEMFCNLLR